MKGTLETLKFRFRKKKPHKNDRDFANNEKLKIASNSIPFAQDETNRLNQVKIRIWRLSAPKKGCSD